MEANLDKDLKSYIKTMPSLPTSLTKVLEVCNNPHTSPADLNHVISLDPVLVGRVLKLINSAYYGMSQPVKSLARAIIMLGINTVKNLALSTTVMGQISSKGETAGLDMEGFWRHSLGVGVSAKLLARMRGIDIKQTEEYFTAGLLHDIGKIPLNTILSKEYFITISLADKRKKSLFETEENTLGINHCTVGSYITSAWKLEGAVGDAITHHHNIAGYTGDFKDIVYCVAVANQFAVSSRIGFSGECHPHPIPPEIWEALNVSRDVLAEIEETVNNESEKAEVFLKIGHL
jgi:putative nucleotidyltransferase with HDIG domain